MHRVMDGGGPIRVEGVAGRVAVVTGGGRGIGRAVTQMLAANGARVAALDIVAPEHLDAVGIACDVSDEAAVEAAFTRVESELGRTSILVLNAGVFPIHGLLDTTRETWDRALAVNATGAFLCARRAIPGMRDQHHGRIITIGSSAGKTGGAGGRTAAYATSKAAVMALTKSIAHEFAADGITANALAPTLIDTPMIAHDPDAVRLVPVGRLGRPEEVAAFVCFLASEHAGYITGEVTDINGGYFID